MDIISVLKQRRKYLGISQTDLSQMSGLSIATIKDIERGVANPSLETLIKICDDYLASGMPSISVLLPRSGGRFSSDTLFPFFINMLPEGANRRMICRELKVDADDNFGLLCRLSDADFIGAVNFKPVQ